MIKVEKISAWGFEHAIRGMRNPYDSWDKSDSYYVDETFKEFIVGKNDLDLMRRLYKAGTEHRKYLRQIFVSMDITAPLYWWKQFDKYQVGVTTNSCSTMHKLMSKPFEYSDFSFDSIPEEYKDSMYMQSLLNTLNSLRKLYLNEKKLTDKKKLWYGVVSLLPEGYNQKRTVTLNYENIMSIIKQRKGHKLHEWDDLIHEFKTLPYINEILEETIDN